MESVWDYPRPPRLEDTTRHIRVIFNDVTIAETRCAKRILETSHPPVYYIPPADIRMDYLTPARGSSFCEWKGSASYYTIRVGDREEHDAAWYYQRPLHPFEALAGYVAFYASRVDACFVDDEKVVPQPGDFYGGWITHDITGPFKGGPGSAGW